MKQENRQGNGYGWVSGFTAKRRVKKGVAIILTCITLFASTSFAHNIDVKKARELARDYGCEVRDLSNGKYLHFSTGCKAMFPNHNHFVRCVIDYQNAKDTTAGVYTCRETIELYHQPHQESGMVSFAIYMKRSSSTYCGPAKVSLEKRLGGFTSERQTLDMAFFQPDTSESFLEAITPETAVTTRP